MDIPEFIKDWSVTIAGKSAESILFNKDITWSPGSQDFLRAQTEGLKRMSEEHYLSRFAPLMIYITNNLLLKIWSNCVTIIAEKLFVRDTTTPEQVKPLIKHLNYPSGDISDNVVKITEWSSSFSPPPIVEFSHSLFDPRLVAISATADENTPSEKMFNALYEYSVFAVD